MTAAVNTSKDVCTCRRAIINVDGVWMHINRNIDHPSNPCHHPAELWVEPPVRWGHLNVVGRIHTN